ncbi:hypothetical protein ACIBCM_11750 [Streptomyces sp. NPDC051018]|uniref:hypothetical protein n=1 Tax=Streptomyces sp. NPDC051018 TaxID=3365639 RepID=UPI003790FB4F
MTGQEKARGPRARRGAFALAVALIVTAGGLASGDGPAPSVTRTEVPVLPLERYELSADEMSAYQRAQKLLAQRCMVSLGFTGFPRDPKMWSGMGRTLTATLVDTGPYGLLDPGQARRLGYGVDTKAIADWMPRDRMMTARESEVMYGGFEEEREAVGGRRVPEGGCAGEASRRLGRGIADATRMWGYVSGRRTALEKKSAEDPRVRHAWGVWSRCLADRGLGRYGNPVDAYTDQAWGRGQNGDTSRTPREMATAKADVECKRQHRTVEVWSGVQKELERADIARNRTRYEEVRRDLDVLRANVGRASAG